MVTRIISGVIAAAILIAVVLVDNNFIFNLAATILSLIGLHEFYSAVKNKGVKPVEIIGYITPLILLGIGYISSNAMLFTIMLCVAGMIIALFISSIITKIKYNVIDIAVTALGVLYITYMFSFLVQINQMKFGYYYIWYVFLGAWMTDIFDYLVGVTIGKHKFSTISPKKSIEGCIGGVIGCVVSFIGYTLFLNSVGLELNYIVMGALGVIVSVISQIGDFAASSIKRYCEIKDFGKIMPGHGGVLDRFDSILFISPLLYAFFVFIC